MMLAVAPLVGITVRAQSPANVRDKAPNPAESFVQENIDKVIAILNDPPVSDADRRQQFPSTLLSITDMPPIGMFVLGRYAMGAQSGRLLPSNTLTPSLLLMVVLLILFNAVNIFRGYADERIVEPCLKVF